MGGGGGGGLKEVLLRSGLEEWLAILCGFIPKTVLTAGHTYSSVYRAAVQPVLVWVIIFFSQAHKVGVVILQETQKHEGV